MKTNTESPVFANTLLANRFSPSGQEPYPDNSPVLLLWDMDLGWIVEAVNDGEYEVQNFPYPEEINEEPDWELAYEIAKERGVRIRYYHRN